MTTVPVHFVTRLGSLTITVSFKVYTTDLAGKRILKFG